MEKVDASLSGAAISCCATTTPKRASVATPSFRSRREKKEKKSHRAMKAARTCELPECVSQGAPLPTRDPFACALLFRAETLTLTTCGNVMFDLAVSLYMY